MREGFDRTVRQAMDALRSMLVVLLVMSLVTSSLPASSLAESMSSGQDASASVNESATISEETPSAPVAQLRDTRDVAASSVGGEQHKDEVRVVDESSFKKVTFSFDSNVAEGDVSSVSGSMTDLVRELDGSEWSLPACGFLRDGFEFSGWSTTRNNRDVLDDASTGNVDEAMPARSLSDKQVFRDLTFSWEHAVSEGDQTKVRVEPCDLSFAERDGRVLLYAQWRPVTQVPLVDTASGLVTPDVDGGSASSVPSDGATSDKVPSDGSSVPSGDATSDKASSDSSSVPSGGAASDKVPSDDSSVPSGGATSDKALSDGSVEVPDVSGKPASSDGGSESSSTSVDDKVPEGAGSVSSSGSSVSSGVQDGVVADDTASGKVSEHESSADGSSGAGISTTDVSQDDADKSSEAIVTVHFDVNGGSGDVPDARFSESDSKALSSVVPSREGFSFGGWAVRTADGAVLRFVDGAVVDRLLVAYVTDDSDWDVAPWRVDLRSLADEDMSVTVQAVWVGSDGVSSDTVTDTVKEGVSQAPESVVGVLNDVRNGSVASAVPASSSRIRLVANGPVADDVEVDVEGDAISIVSPKCPFSWSRHEFVGWDTRADGTGQRFGKNEDVSVSGIRVLYAQWRVTYPDVSDELDFTNKRLVVGMQSKPSVGEVLSEHDGIWLLGFDDKASAAWAYLDLKPVADFVAPDITIAPAEASSKSLGEAVAEARSASVEELSPYDATAAYEEGNWQDVANLSSIDDVSAGAGPLVALVDSGVNGHDDVVVSRTSVLDGMVIDDVGHGTNMLETMLSVDSSIRVASIKAIGASGTATAASVYTAIECAIEMRAKVINLSLSAPATEGNAAVERAIRDAYAAGIIVVGAAGNDGRDAKWFIPGRMGNEAVIAGSCDADGKRIERSNFGSTVDTYVPSASTSYAAAKVSAWLARHGSFGHELDELRTDAAKEALGLRFGDTVNGFEDVDETQPEHADFSASWTHPTLQMYTHISNVGSMTAQGDIKYNNAYVGNFLPYAKSPGASDGIWASSLISHNGGGAHHTTVHHESFAVKISNAGSVSGTNSMQYQGHIQDIGWTGWVNSFNWVTPIGKAKRCEAFQVKFTGNIANLYNTNYSADGFSATNDAHYSNNASNGGTAGTTGVTLDIVGLRIGYTCKSFNRIIQVRYQDANGNWGSWSNVVNANYNTGSKVSWSRAQDATYNAASGSWEVAGAATNQISVSRRTATNTIRVRYQNADGSWGNYSNASSGANYVGQVRSWSRAQDATYKAASASITGTASNQTKDVSVSRRTATNTIRARYQDANGNWGSYSNVSSGANYVGQVRSWSRAQDATYNAASASITGTASNQTKDVSVSRRTATNTIRARYQNADGSWGNYSNVSSGTNYVGQVRSWSRAQDATYAAASGSITGTASNQTKDVSVYRRTATNTIRARYQNADGSWGNYSNVSSGSNYVGQVRSWSRAQDTTYAAASASITGTASNQTKDVSVSRRQYYVDLNGKLNGTNASNVTDFATVDVYVPNTTKVSTGVTDYYAQQYYQNTWKMVATAKSGKHFSGGNTTSQTKSGTVGTSNDVRFELASWPTIDRITAVQNGMNSFYAYANVTNNGGGINRVQFPTWTSANDQDDLVANWSTVAAASGTAGSWTVGGQSYNYRFEVKISDHKNERGRYNVHVYAYDNYGGSVVKTMTFDFKYTLHFNANGGSGTMSDQAVVWDTDTTLFQNTFSRSGYTFNGWATSASGGVRYGDRQTTYFASDYVSGGTVINLYAVWAKNGDEVGTKDATFSYTGAPQSWRAPKAGTYLFEAWGAQGGTLGSGAGGKGGYTAGRVALASGRLVYVYVGGQGYQHAAVTNPGGWNGGGYSGNNRGGQSAGGGGATDFRTSGGAWNDPTGLSSRVMVAAGGGATVSATTTAAGAGGGLTGGAGTSSNATYNTGTYLPKGGSQSAGGFGYQNTSARNGVFGSGVTLNSGGWGGGGGGGWYGGGNGHGTTGAGGSSYVSGMSGCTVNSAMSFTSASTSAGVRAGNGMARITYVPRIDYKYHNGAFSDSYVINGSVTLPNPSTPGFTFLGWFDAETAGTLVGKGGASLTYSDDKVLHAQWHEHEYSVTFDVGTAESSLVTLPETASLHYSESYTIPSLTCSMPGRAFDHWEDGSGKVYHAGDVVSKLVDADGGSVKLTAKYSIDMSNLSAKVHVNFVRGTLQANQFRYCIWNDGSTFTDYSWNDASGLVSLPVDKSEMSVGDVRTYVVSVVDKSLPNVAYDEDVTYVKLVRTADEVNVWYAKQPFSEERRVTESDAPSFDASSPDTSVWSRKEPVYNHVLTSYEVMFDANAPVDDVTGVQETVTVDRGTSYQIPDCSYTREIYEFCGWNTKADGTGTTYWVGSKHVDLAGDGETSITLYAQWRGKQMRVRVPVAVHYTADSQGVLSGPTDGVVSVANRGETCVEVSSLRAEAADGLTFVPEDEVDSDNEVGLGMRLGGASRVEFSDLVGDVRRYGWMDVGGTLSMDNLQGRVGSWNGPADVPVGVLHWQFRTVRARDK